MKPFLIYKYMFLDWLDLMWWKIRHIGKPICRGCKDCEPLINGLCSWCIPTDETTCNAIGVIYPPVRWY